MTIDKIDPFNTQPQYIKNLWGTDNEATDFNGIQRDSKATNKIDPGCSY